MLAPSTKPRRRRNHKTPRRSRQNRAAKIHTPTYITRKIPVYELLNEEGLQRLDDHADWILSDVGIEFRGDNEALKLFKAAGATVQGSRVRFDKGHARTLCATAPREFKMFGRNPARTTTFGGNRVIFAPAYGPPFVSDIKHGRRYGTIKDFENFVKLTYLSPWLQHGSGTLCEPVDIPVNKRHLDMVYAHLRYSDKPFMGGVTAHERAQDSVEMARLVFGDDFMAQNCVIQGNINVNSPLVYDEVMSGALRVYAAANQGLVISPFILGGAMSPVTMGAALAQAHAEAMVGIALSQLVQPGCPVVYGNFLTTMDLKTGAPTFGTPESSLAAQAIGQLARRLGLPFRCGGHYTASKVADGQAMQESADSMMAGLMAGANFIFQAAGWLEGGLTIGYEKFVMDADHCGILNRYLQGLNLDENHLGADAFQEVGSGGNFLGSRHTLANFRSANHRSELADNNSFEQWTEAGRHDMEQRAYERWKAMLKAYEAPPLDPAIDEALKAFIRKKKDGMPDEWY
ncbi:MAG: trimethylamine methyltransferase family protein [Chloroflexota bacterium]